MDCNKATQGVKCWGQKIPASIVSEQSGVAAALPTATAAAVAVVAQSPNSLPDPHTQDILSLDMYCPVTDGAMSSCQTNGKFDPAAEVKWVKPFYDTQIIPRLQPHQKVPQTIRTAICLVHAVRVS